MVSFNLLHYLLFPESRNEVLRLDETEMEHIFDRSTWSVLFILQHVVWNTTAGGSLPVLLNLIPCLKWKPPGLVITSELCPFAVTM